MRERTEEMLATIVVAVASVSCAKGGHGRT